MIRGFYKDNLRKTNKCLKYVNNKERTVGNPLTIKVPLNVILCCNCIIIKS